MKIKKKELTKALTNLESLKTLPLEGIVSLSVIKLTKSVTDNKKKHEDARKEVMQAYCARKEDGSLDVETRQAGAEMYEYYNFGTPEKSKEAFDKVEEIENEEISIDVYKTITEQYIESLGKITPDQVNGLLLLTE